MYLVLQQESGTATISIRQGQRVTIGRTQWADHAFPHDEGLAPVHFSVEYSQAGAIALPLEDAVLLLDGEPTQGAALRNGQQLQAGNIVLNVFMQGEGELLAESQADPQQEELPQTAEDSRPPWVSAEETLKALLLPPIPQDVTPEPSTPVELAQLLATMTRHGDAIQVLAWSMKPAQAIKWVADCIQESLSDTLNDAERAALDASRTWCSESSEANCKAAGEAAEIVGLETPPGWVAQATFWSGDNLSTPDLPPVKPPPTLASAGIKGAIVALAFAIQPDAPDTVMSQCLNAGFELVASTSERPAE